MKKKIYFFALAAMMSASAMAETYYVAPAAKGAGNGSNWENAMAPGEWNFLAGDVVYLQEGTYITPSITLVNGVQYIGGFSKNATGTDVSGYDPESNVTKLTPLGSNTAQFLVLVGDDRQTETVLKGLTITGVAGTQDATKKSIVGSVANIQSAWLTMQDVIVTGNATRCGGIIVAEASVLKCRRCVFSNNVQEMQYADGKTEDGSATTTTNASILFNLLGAAADKANTLVLDRCAIYGNSFASSDLMAHARDGGLINTQKGASHHVVLVNNFIDGNGIVCHSFSSFMRTNGGASATDHAVALMAYNTIYNLSVAERFATGSVITCGGNSGAYLGANIIVSPTPYEEFDINSIGTAGGEKNTATAAVFNSDCALNPSESSTSNQCLTFGNTSKTSPALWIGAGYNYVGGRTMIKRGNYWVEDKWSVNKSYEIGDNWKVLVQSEMFGDNQPYTDGYVGYIEPLDGKDFNVVDTEKVAEAWNCPEWRGYLTGEYVKGDLLKHIEDIDLSVDITGAKRGAQSWPGCYDKNAIPSAVKDLNGEESVNVIKVAEGVYEVAGAATVDAYDMSGRCVAKGSNRVNLNGAAKGVYVIKAGAKTVKVML